MGARGYPVGMGKAKWWVCGDCKSLNDKPANKCYKCRSPKPDNPTLMDDEYSEVGGGQQRVGITVDLTQVDLATRDPKETQRAGGIYEDFVPQTQQGGRYGAEDDQPLASSRADIEPAAPPPPLREPATRSIAEAGGRHWLKDYTGLGAGSGQPATQTAGASPPAVPTTASQPTHPPPSGPPTPPPTAASQPLQPPPSGFVPPGQPASQPPGPPLPPSAPGQVPPGAAAQGLPPMPPPPPGQGPPPGSARPPAPPPAPGTVPPPPAAASPPGTSAPPPQGASPPGVRPPPGAATPPGSAVPPGAAAPPGSTPPPATPPPARPATPPQAPQPPPTDGQDPA